MEIKTKKQLEKFSTIISCAGIICFFIGIWASGWMILRFIITGIMLLFWSINIDKKLKEAHDGKDNRHDINI